MSISRCSSSETEGIKSVSPNAVLFAAVKDRCRSARARRRNEAVKRTRNGEMSQQTNDTKQDLRNLSRSCSSRCALELQPDLVLGDLCQRCRKAIVVHQGDTVLV